MYHKVTMKLGLLHCFVKDKKIIRDCLSTKSLVTRTLGLVRATILDYCQKCKADGGSILVKRMMYVRMDWGGIAQR